MTLPPMLGVGAIESGGDYGKGVLLLTRVTGAAADQFTSVILGFGPNVTRSSSDFLKPPCFETLRRRSKLLTTLQANKVHLWVRHTHRSSS